MDSIILEPKSSSETGNGKTASSSTIILVKDVGHESSMSSNQSDLVQGPATKELGFSITGWTTIPEPSSTTRRSVRLGEYPLILSSKHLGESHYVTIMFATEEVIGMGRSVLPMACRDCGTVLIKDAQKVPKCLRCNKEIASPEHLTSRQSSLIGDFFQHVGWNSEIEYNEPTRFISIPLTSLKNKDVSMLFNRCQNCGARLIIFHRVPFCAWCGRNSGEKDGEIEVAYHVQVTGSGHPCITFQRGESSRSLER